MTRMPTLIETVRVRDGRAPLWYLHLRRLVESCRALGVPFPPAFEVPTGADRVHRIAVGAKGLQVTERPVGSTAPVWLVTAR
ncbi:MAG: aminotransferase class IV, partial [Gemmatimonadales bacterium]